MTDDLTKFVNCKACRIKINYHAMDKRVAYNDTRLILIPTGWETDWANVKTSIQRMKEYNGEPVGSVSLQPKIINFNNYSNYISRFNFIQYKNYYWKHKMQTFACPWL